MDDLRFYDSASWSDKDVAGTVDEGLGFTIYGKVSVNGSPQYKVHNSKGKTKKPSYGRFFRFNST